jgi:hypothetical protein
MINDRIPESVDIYTTISSQFVKHLDPRDAELFRQQFNFPALARLLTEYSSQGLIQVGTTEEEALGIVNQHSHHESKIIVKLSVPQKTLTDKNFSEQELWGDISFTYRADRQYVCLLQNTLIESSQIISVKPMPYSGYKNTFKGGDLRPELYWPNDLIITNNGEVDASLPEPDMSYHSPESIVPAKYQDKPEEYFEKISKIYKKMDPNNPDANTPHPSNGRRNMFFKDASKAIGLQAAFDVVPVEYSDFPGRFFEERMKLCQFLKKDSQKEFLKLNILPFEM